MAEGGHSTPESLSESEDCSVGEVAMAAQQMNESENNVVGAGAGCSEADVADGLEKLFQQNRSERMFELRRLQLGEKPVTGHDSRERLDTYFMKRFQASANAESSHNAPSNTDDVEEHRPESVVVEVTGLLQQQRVSSVLGSAQFRRRLDNIIRGNLSSLRQSAPQNSTPRPPPAPSSGGIPVPPPPPGELYLQRTPFGSRHDSQSSLSSYGSAQYASNNTPPPPPPLMGASQAAPSRSNNAAPNPPHHGAANPRPPPPQNMFTPESRTPWLLREPQAVNNWNNIEQSQRENMIADISELVQRQLVTSTLDGDFRTVLETRMRDHVANTGTDGQRVANFVQSLPQPGIIRNDFSHLGIQSPEQQQDFLDNISVVSASMSVPYVHSNLAVNREMQAMKAQIQELKSMMELSFNMQMEIQRAIRQEVSAALATVAAPAATPAPAVYSTPVRDTHCLICLDRHADSVLYQCGHMCLCHQCGMDLQVRRGGSCPVCRAPIRDVIRVYKTNPE